MLKATARDYRDKVAQATLDKAAASIKKFKAMGGKIVKLSEGG